MIFHVEKKLVKFILLLCGIVVLFAGCYFVLSYFEYSEPVETVTADTLQNPLQQTGMVEKDLTILLLLGIDKEGKMEKVKSNINDAQCDFLTLVLLDEENGTYDLLQLNRDTMTPVDVLGIGGGIVEQVTMQLALSHTYGNAMEQSCENSVRAVERFLGGVEIDHYLALNMTGMEKLVDAIGGVTVTIVDDFSKVDPTLVQGETMLLNGKQCLTYIRGRKNVEDQSNLTRSERQRQFMKELLPTMQKNGKLTLDTITEIADYMLTDLDGGSLDALMTKITESTFKDIHTPAGEAVVGKRFMEFYADENQLQELVEKLFYKENKE